MRLLSNARLRAQLVFTTMRMPGCWENMRHRFHPGLFHWMLENQHQLSSVKAEDFRRKL